ncbi:IS4 family transposase [Anaerotalea alkaliphila]|uniref:IS4 family transposase n=1 Tax=Anaerotalea alkaliphila TaxID=2662126 RepID=UPI0031B61CE8
MSHTYKRGFRLLTLGWSDGNTFLPVNSALLASEKTSNLYQGMQAGIDKRTLGFKRKALAQTKATKVMMDLLDQARQGGLQASHVLFDTWFCSPSTILEVKSRQLDVIAMAKKSAKTYYTYNGVRQPLTKIYQSSKKRRGRSKYLLLLEILIEKDGKSIPARLVCVRNRNKRKDWLALISTDITINEEEIIRLYGKRWNIEVFFKVCKSYLRLAKDCRSLSYDAVSAHVSIVFSRYILLAVENRKETDQRSFGELFYSVTDEMEDITLQEAMLMLMQAFLSTIEDKLSLTERQLNEFLDAFFMNLPQPLQLGLKRCA